MTYSQSSSSSSQSTSPLTTISTTITTTDNPTTQSVTIHDEPIFNTKTPSSSSLSSINSENVKLVEETATEILLATTSKTTSSPSPPIETTTKEIFAAVSQPRPFGFTRGRSRSSSSSSFLDSTTPLSSATLPSRSKVSSKSSRNFARSSNTNQTRGRARSRVTTETSNRERFKTDDSGYQEITTPVSKFRSRTRGSSRNRLTLTTPANEINTKSRSIPVDEINNRSRSRITTSVPSVNRNQSSRRGRRPTSKSNIGRGSRNELDDSPIIRISSENSPRDQSRKSRRPGKSVDEASSQITNIRIFKDSENIDTRSRNRQSSRRFEDSTAQASFRDLSETTSTSRLEEETFFSPSSSYNFAKTTGTYFKSTDEKDDSRGWTGLNSIHPYYSTDLGVNTVTYPSISTEPIRNRNLRRKFTTADEFSRRSSTTESTSSRRRIILLRRRTGVETSTTANDENNFQNKRRKVIRRLRPVQEEKSTTAKQTDQFRSRYIGRSTTPKIEKIITSTENPSTFHVDYTTQPITTNFDFNPDSTEGKTTLPEETTKDFSTISDYFNFKTTDFDTSTLPTTLIIPDDPTTEDLKTTFNYKIYETKLPETSAFFEATSPLPVKTTESANSRYKYSRRIPHPTSAITNARRFPTATTANPNLSTEANPEALAKRRKNLFIRRRPSTKTQVEEEINSEREISHPKIKNISNSSSSGPDEFWKSFNTVRTFSPKASTENPLLLLHTHPLNSENEDKLGPVYRRPEYRPIVRTSSTQLPLEETNNSNLRSTLSIYRKPRVRVQIDDNDPDDNDDSKNRFFPNRISTTEQTVTETLIPAKKFDYVADAYLRKQSQRGSSKSRTKDENELQNFVDIYSTTPSSKPQITRLVTSVVESATTERQKILIRRKYSQLASTSLIPMETTQNPISFSLKSKLKEKLNFQNEIRTDTSTETSIEKSTLPIESAFRGKFTTESSGESSTIEIESVFNNLITSSRDSRQ